MDEAKELLKEHIESVEELYINPIRETISSIDVDSFSLNDIWKSEILPKYNVIDKIDSLKSYSSIKERKDYPELILECKTGSISMRETTTKHFLRVDNKKDELLKIRETERILGQCCKNINPYIEIKHIIQINEILNTLSYVEGCKTINYNKFYRNRISEKIKIDLISGELKLNDRCYNIQNIDLNEIKNIIDNIYADSIKETQNYIEDELNKRKEKFNKAHIYDILNVVNDFPKKGITTYVSILIGESSSKIKSNDYDKTESYGKMAEYTTSYITNKIRELIKEDFIEENTYKASFGRYIGLTLNSESKDYIDNYDMKNDLTNINNPSEDIKCFNTLLHKLRTSSSSRARVLLVKATESSISFERDNFDKLLSFIEKDRALYREYEDVFNKCISKIVPVNYKPLFLLNSNFASGVNKKTLKSIYELMS